MCASQLHYRSLLARAAFMLLLPPWVALAPNTALAQQRLLTPLQPEQSHRLNLQFSGEQPRPLAMVSGDFDEDGVADLVIGYGLEKGGSIAFLRGNLDAIAPQTEVSWLAASKHQHSDPFLQPSKMTTLTTQPSMMISADVNGDGHLDLVYATKGSAQLNVMFGDGKGKFLAPISATIPGGITALAAYRPGAPLPGEAVIVGYESRQGAGLGIVSLGATGLSINAKYPLHSAATMLTVANLDADLIPDTAIVAGGQLLILHGKNAISGHGAMTTVPVSEVESVTAGEFLFDRHAQLQLSVLTSAGDVLTFAHEGFDPRPYSSEQLAETRRQQHGRTNAPTLAQQAGNDGNAPWVEVEEHLGVGAYAQGDKASILIRSRSSGSGGDDLVVINSSQQQRTLIRHSLPISSDFSASPRARVTSSRLTSGDAVAALSLRVNPDVSQGLVLLSSDNVSPEVVVPSHNNTFVVNTFADNTVPVPAPGPNSCTATCTLRDAVTYANDDAADNLSMGTSDTIMVPAGTYNLTYQAGVFDANGNLLSHLEVFGPVTIMGASGGGTIINGGNSDVVFTINPGVVGSYNGGVNPVVFDALLENLTIQNGTNKNNPNVTMTGFENNFGGCVNWDADGTGNLTITNSVIERCTIFYGAGGGIWAFNSAGGGTGTLTLSGDTIINNSTPEEGGGISIAFAPAALSATNTVFSGNIAEPSVHNDPNAFGEGGGLDIVGREPPPATPQTTLTNVTISSNIASPNDGGGIYTNSGISIGSSLIENNSSGRWGGGVFSEVASPFETQTTITSSSFLSNSATVAGGAISTGVESAANGNILQISLSRIFGNTSNGASGIAAGTPSPDSQQFSGEVIATDNWWGCNGGPTASGDGCDQAVLYKSSSGNGPLTTAPYAQLGFTSNITTIPVGGSMDLTVTMGSGIAGAFPAVATSYPYTYNVTGVTANPALTTGTFNTAGVGTATLTPVTPTTNTPGTVTVTFDNQTDTIHFTADAATPTSLAIMSSSTTFVYGQPPTFTVQLTPSNATGVTASDFTITVDGSSVGYGLAMISNNNYAITGPFNLLPPGVNQTLKVSFAGTGNYGSTSTSVGLTVLQGSVTIGDTTTPPKPVQGQGGTINVTVTGMGTGATPTGSITYAFDGGTPSTVSLSGGAAAISIPTIIATGNHSLALTYSGDTNYGSATTTVTITIYGKSQTTIAAITSTTATIDVFGFGFTSPSGQLAFTDVTSSNPVAPSVTLNTATATTALTPQATTSTGANTLPDWTTLGDVNGDGKLDLVTSLYNTDRFSVQLGNGDGTFQPATTSTHLISTGFGPAENHLVSLRGNGTLDLIVGSFNTNQIAVLLGNGNGSFHAPVFYTVGMATNTPTSLTTGDFNHDGHLDVAVANTGDNTISIFLGDGTGALTPLGSPINVGRVPQAIRAGDFNDDGYSDLAVANYSDGTVTILLNNQNGTFTKSTVTVGSGAGSGPQALAITGSGSSLLLAVANYKNNAVSVMHSNGNGTFGTQTIVPVGKGPDDLSFADFNGDGIEDLVVSNYTDGSVDLLLGGSGGSYTLVGPFKVGNNPYSAAVGDLDLDGTPDIVVSNTFSNNTGVLLDGTQISVPYTALSFTPGHMLSATYTPDGASKYGSSTSPSVTAP